MVMSPSGLRGAGMKILVIGGCGFIGSHIVDALLRDGHEVRVLTLVPERFRQPLPGVDYRFGSFLDPSTLAAAVTGMDAVFHVASTTFPTTADKDPRADVRDNLLGTMGVVETMLDCGVRRLLFLSSGGTVYGIPETVPIPETHPLRPIASYGIVKATIEHFLNHYRRTRDLSVVIIRASNPVGARQSSIGIQGVVATFLDKIASGEPIEIWGDGSVVRDYVDVVDLAEFCALAGTGDRDGPYNAGSGIGTSINEIVELVRDVTGRPVVPVHRDCRPSDVPVSVLAMTKAEKDFGWSPKRSVREAIESAWAWRMSQGG